MNQVRVVLDKLCETVEHLMIFGAQWDFFDTPGYLSLV